MKNAAGILLIAASLVGAVSTAGGASPSKGFSFLVRSTEGGIAIERARPSSNPGPARPVALITEDWTRHPPGTEELVVTLHSESGKLLGTYAFPTRRLAFWDQPETGGHILSGGPRDLPSTDMLVTVPANKKPAFAVFWRVRTLDRADAPESPPPPSQVIHGSGPFGPVALMLEPEGFYPFRPRPALPANLEIPVLSTARNPPRRFLPDASVILPLTLNSTAATSPPAIPCDFTNLGIGTANASSFNVVILGDGYRSSEMTDFNSDALGVKTKLLATRPFSQFAAKINVYAIETPSTDSGVEWCPRSCTYANTSKCDRCPSPPDASVKTTALDVEGNASGIGSCTEFRQSLTKVFDAVVTCGAIDPADVNLYIVLVNCYVYGAMTYPASHTVYIAAGYATEMLTHEVGHAIGLLGEEYISGVLPHPATSCGSTCAPPRIFANVALSGVGSSTAPWLSLAKASEKSAGALTHVEEQSGGTYYTDTAPTGTTVGEGQKLGLYWGAQYLTDGDDPCGDCNACGSVCRVMVNGNCVTLCKDKWNDARGAAFHRPMPYCTMRTLNMPYCRVCYCALRSVLVNSTGLTPTTSWCPP